MKLMKLAPALAVVLTASVAAIDFAADRERPPRGDGIQPACARARAVQRHHAVDRRRQHDDQETLRYGERAIALHLKPGESRQLAASEFARGSGRGIDGCCAN
jgi:hypothetical protein